MRLPALGKSLPLFLTLLSGCTISSFYMPPGPYSADARVLQKIGHMAFAGIDESSALEKSQRFPDTYWTLNDSGGGPRIFAIRASGESIEPVQILKYRGIQIDNATNIDWEAMTLDDHGNLYLADIGNNDSRRRNLSIYLLTEPDPLSTERTPALARIPVSYPDQREFPSTAKNFDAEALFWLRDHLYVLSKRRSDTRTVLYRLASTDPTRDNHLVQVDSFDVGGMVTAADASDDGSLLAILTYHDIWLVEVQTAGSSLFQGRKYRLPIRLRQCEGICFDDDRILISNEEGDIFAVSLQEIKTKPVLQP